MEKYTKFRSLNAAEAEESAKKYGENRIGTPKTKSFVRLFFAGFRDPVIVVLLASLGINLLFSFQTFRWYETAGIFLAVVISTFVSTLSEKGSEKAFLKMQEESRKSFARVVRAGEVVLLPTEKIVVGDLVLLGAGEKIPADGILLSGKLEADQSALNGEGEECRKEAGGAGEAGDLLSSRHLFSGSLCVAGEGVEKVTAVGEKTHYGKIALSLSESTRESPLKTRLGVLAGQISRIGSLCAGAVGIISLLSYFLSGTHFSAAAILCRFSDPAGVFSALLRSLSLAITVVVVAVPEGLPMMISVVLASNMKRMAKSRVLVRKPVGIETAGSMNLLITDKTGTLTEGRQSVSSLLLGNGKEFPKPALFRKTPLFKAFREAVFPLSDAVWGKSGALGGNATDRALLTFAGRGGHERPILEKIPFNSERKFGAVRCGGEKKENFMKGAPEILLPEIIGFLDENGEEKPFSTAEKKAFARRLSELGEKGRRLLLVARSEDDRFGAFLIAAVAFADPIRRDAEKSVQTLLDAGIGVVMMTGDGKETACRIAREAGILKKSGETGAVFSGKEFRALSPEERQKSLPHLRVIYRSLPQDKELLARDAQSAGYICGMTGDGLNDAPALKIADVGFAMGSGTEVAKDAADIVITDDSLSSVAAAVLYGRTIFKSIRKFIVFQLSMNFIAVAVSILAPLGGVEQPITVLQMLWINLIMDTLGGLAFAGEAPSRFTMREKPKKPEENILNGAMQSQIAGGCIFSASLLLFFLFFPIFRSLYASREVFMTVFFCLFIFIAVLNCFNARTERLNIFAGLFKNPVFCGVIAGVLGVQVLIVSFGGALFRTVPLCAGEWRLPFLLALTVIPFDLCRKLIRKKRGKETSF